MAQVKDITEEWNHYNKIKDINESVNDYFDWKYIRAEGYDRVKIEDKIYEFNKWGIINES